MNITTLHSCTLTILTIITTIGFLFAMYKLIKNRKAEETSKQYAKAGMYWVLGWAILIGFSDIIYLIGKPDTTIIPDSPLFDRIFVTAGCIFTMMIPFAASCYLIQKGARVIFLNRIAKDQEQRKTKKPVK